MLETCQMTDIHQRFNDFLKSKQLRNTYQRIIILDQFFKKQGHVTIDELFQTIRRTDPTIGQSTIYRTLYLLVEAGLAQEVYFGNGTIRYEPCPTAEHHDHLICRNCGKVVEFSDSAVEYLRDQIAEDSGFAVLMHRFAIYGFCKDCKKKS